MTVDAAWEFAVDLNKDGDYDDTGEDISAFVEDVEWSLGFGKQYDTMSRMAELTMELDNKTNIFSPDHASALSGFTIGRVVRVQSTFSFITPVTRDMFLGWIVSIDPDPGIKSGQKCIVRCEGWISRAINTPVKIPVQLGKTADEVVTTILETTLAFPPGFESPGFAKRWLLGQVGSGELGAMVLGAVGDFLIVDSGGISTFSYVGDRWGPTTNVRDAIEDIVGQENGRIFVDRSGIINFWDRHRLIRTASSSATVNNTMVEMDYAFGEDIINRAVVSARPRRVSNAPEIMAKIDQPQQIFAGKSEQVTFHYQQADDSGVLVGGIHAITPEKNADFTANDASDGSGTDRTDLITVVLDEEFATQAKATYTNGHTNDVWLQPGIRIRAIKITDWGVNERDAEDEDSQFSFGRREFIYPFVMDSLADAQALAEYRVSIQKDPRGNIRKVWFSPRSSAALMDLALANSIGIRLTVIEDETGQNSDVWIIGERHTLKGKTKEQTVEWTTEPADPVKYWLLNVAGRGELGTVTNIGPF